MREDMFGPVWRNYFEDILILGISGDCVENIFWRTQDISLLHTTLFVIMHCGTNNLNQMQRKDILAESRKLPKS